MARSNELKVYVVGDASSLNKTLDQAGSSAKKFGKLAGVGIAAGLGLAAVGMKKAIDAASNLNESVNAVNVVFGKSAKQIHNFSAKAARQAGLSMRELNELVVPLGASFQNMGDSSDVAAKKSINLAKRAADLASVYNVDVKTALGAIQAGLRGEADPLEKFGVGLNDAAVEAAALGMGLSKTKTDLTAVDKAQARYTLIMSQSKQVAGDFKNTSGGLANQQRILGAEFENLQAKIGQKLIPIVTKAVLWFGDHWPAAAAKIQEVWDQKVKPALEDMAPTMKAIGDLAKTVAALIEKHWGTIGPIVAQVVNIIKTALIQIGNIIKLFTAILRGDWQAAWDALKAIVSTALTQVVNVLRLYKDTVLTAMAKIGKAIGNGIISGLNEIDDLLKRAITGLFEKAIQWVKDVLGIKSPSSVFAEIGKNMIRGMVGGIGSMGGYLKDAVVKLAKSVPGRVLGAVRGSTPGAPNMGGLDPRVANAVIVAGQRGWHGSVTSGFRSRAEQAALYARYLAGGPLAARPGTSSHERGEAVDVTDYQTFGRIMAQLPSSMRLYNRLGAIDPVHYSVSGYAKGGIFNRPTLGVIGEAGPEAVIPLSRGRGRPMQVNLQLDGRTLASVLLDPLRGEVQQLRRAGGRF